MSLTFFLNISKSQNWRTVRHVIITLSLVSWLSFLSKPKKISGEYSVTHLKNAEHTGHQVRRFRHFFSTNSTKITWIPFLFYWFLLSCTFSTILSPPLYHPPMTPMLPIYSGDFVFSYFSCRLDPYMSLLGSSLFSRFSGIVNCSLVFFALFLKASYEWIQVIFVFLGLSYLTQYDVF